MAKGGPVRKKRPESGGAVPGEKALFAALVVALGAGLLGMGFGSSYVELVRDYATCSSAERVYIASTSLAEATHVLFVVDDLEDRHLRDGFNRVPPSREAACIGVPTEGPQLRSTCGKTGRCTLRAALEEAATIHRHTPVTMQLRGGLFRLAAPLPEVVGAVHVVGTEPGSASTALVGGGGPQPLSRIGVAPDELETIIDGSGSVQILRTDPYSRLHLQALRLLERERPYLHTHWLTHCSSHCHAHCPTLPYLAAGSAAGERRGAHPREDRPPPRAGWRHQRLGQPHAHQHRRARQPRHQRRRAVHGGRRRGAQLAPRAQPGAPVRRRALRSGGRQGAPRPLGHPHGHPHQP